MRTKAELRRMRREREGRPPKGTLELFLIGVALLGVVAGLYMVAIGVGGFVNTFVSIFE